MEPTPRVDRLSRRLRLVEIALHDVRTLRQNLAVVRDLDLHTRSSGADGADADLRRRIDGDERRRLGQPIPFENHQTRRIENLSDLGAERSAARPDVLPP